MSRTRILIGAFVAALGFAAVAYAMDRFTVKPDEFDPGHTHLVQGAWLGGIGCPTNAKTPPGPSCSTASDCFIAPPAGRSTPSRPTSAGYMTPGSTMSNATGCRRTRRRCHGCRRLWLVACGARVPNHVFCIARALQRRRDHSRRRALWRTLQRLSRRPRSRRRTARLHADDQAAGSRRT